MPRHRLALSLELNDSFSASFAKERKPQKKESLSLKATILFVKK